MKTHIVLDTFYEEDQETFYGTLEECQNFIRENSSPMEQILQFYKIRPLTEKEFNYANDIK